MTKKYSLGWVPDLPDVRDFSPDDMKGYRASNKTKTDAKDAVRSWFKKSAALSRDAGLEPHVDLTEYCSPIENQGGLGSCTANAAAGLIEYYERRAFGKHLDASRLFLYKVTRKLLGWTGDTGAYLRTTMGAMALFGTLPEDEYPYVESQFDDEPSAFNYAYAQNYQSLSYFRLDQADMTPAQVLDRVKRFAAAGYPSMFGFSVYNFGNADGEFEFPKPSDSLQGGHAVDVVGYDDDRVISGKKGALKIRNSWGVGWGESGYGWLPYEYVLQGLAVDFWSVFRAEYVDVKAFR